MPVVGRIIPSEFLSRVTRLKLGRKDPIRAAVLVIKADSSK
jgi:hypothetical protein